MAFWKFLQSLKKWRKMSPIENTEEGKNGFGFGLGVYL